MSTDFFDEKPPGPIEAVPWAKQLTARVVTPGAVPRIHGYDVEGDLARNYSFAETVLLALTGVVPDRTTGRAFEAAMVFLAPVAVSDAPTHAAVLSRICHAPTASIIYVGAILLVEQVRFLIESHDEFLKWLDGGSTGGIPEKFCANGDEDRASVDRLRRIVTEAGLRCPALDADPGRTAAALAVLHACGLNHPGAIQAAMVTARLPVLAAEALRATPGALLSYPTGLPRFCYERTDATTDSTSSDPGGQGLLG